MTSAKSKILNSTRERAQSFLDYLQTQGGMSAEEVQEVREKMNGIFEYVPCVGIFGKTGVGKSSLCNALFGADVAEVSDVRACTRAPQDYLLSVGNDKGIKLVDMPGVGENQERDKEYRDLYKSLLPKLDIILWVLKGDDRAHATEEQFFKDVVKPYIQDIPFIAVINQVDKIQPFREWDEKANAPSPKQAVNIKDKRLEVKALFSVQDQRVVAVSANERYNLGQLLTTIVRALPKEKRLGVVREAKDEAQSEEAQHEAERGFWQSVWEIVQPIAEQVVKVASEWVKNQLPSFLRW